MLDQDYKKEIKRKILHYGAILIPTLYYFTDKIYILVSLACIIIIIAILEYLRQHNEQLNQKFLKLFGGMHRPEEAHKTSALIFTFSGNFFTILLFEKNIAIISLFFFIIGDGVAALVGKKYGRIKIFGKTLEGTLANFISCIIVGFFIIKIIPASITVILGAVTCAVFELLPLPVNDNFIVPIITALIMTIL